MSYTGEDLISEAEIGEISAITRFEWKSLEIFHLLYFVIRFPFDAGTLGFDRASLSDFCNKKSTRTVDMRPPFFLEDDFECVRIFFLHAKEDSFILNKIESTCRIDHLT